MKDIEWLNESRRSWLMAMKGCPKRTNSTIFVEPALGTGVTRITRESGKIPA
jgi:hypothetical protein